jgi:hypothetical protein
LTDPREEPAIGVWEFESLACIAIPVLPATGLAIAQKHPMATIKEWR